MAGRRDNYSISIFVCTSCKTEMPIPRWNKHKREKKHIKDLYCPTCKRIEKFIEYRDIDCYKTLDGKIINI